jgi:hypothetical protein
VIALKIKPDPEDEDDKGGIFTLSVEEPKQHLQILMEATQHFAKNIGYPLELMVIQKDPQQG